MKAWELPIRSNPLRTREDLARSLDQLLEPLLGRFVGGGSGLHIGNSSAHYDERAALLEGWSRLLWGLGPYAAGKGSLGGLSPAGGKGRPSDAALATMLRGLGVGPNPDSPWYWGKGGARDQRFVEMAAIALSLLLAPEAFWEPLPSKAKADLAAWLRTIEGAELPPTNWEFFRALVGLALKVLDLPRDEAALPRSLDAVEALYRADGWYQDETNYDLYNPFAFHFYGLVYARFAGAEDPERAGRFRERARLFAAQYLPWFGSDGSAVPFGRSLCYRFAASAFFSACAFAGEDLLPWGAMKGLVLRNLRWWYGRPIFDHEGALTVGYAYPNLIAAEQYNAPGSPYWALKTYLVLALPPSHPFWTSEEQGLPVMPELAPNGPPKLLACRSGSGTGEHVVLLNAGQYPCWESVGAAAKYAKFAYSNRFGFCVSHGSFDLSKTGCDSSLLFSEGDGYWRERRQSEERFSCEDYVSSVWRPWPDLRVKTWLVPAGRWHIRVHAIESGRELDCAEGGFSLPDRNGFGPPLRPLVAAAEGALLARLPWAAGGIVELSPEAGRGGPGPRRRPELHRPEPNLNLLYPKVFVPLLRGRLGRGRTVLACAVYAEPLCEEGEDIPAGWEEMVPAGWAARPAAVFEDGKVTLRTGKKEIVVQLWD